uniref:Uncharacterized protein n=1 Tax=Timema shepardi TaxID=629360 RepID=A0A7R9ARD3_TIMSH|nr:unnamed protein product [Timema shepardi]
MNARVDPLREVGTIAGVVMLVYCRSHLKENTVGIIPYGGYRCVDQQSHVAGCYWHGFPLCYPDRNTPIKNSSHETTEMRHETTMACVKKFKNAGNKVVEMWECTHRQGLNNLYSSTRCTARNPSVPGTHSLHNDKEVRRLAVVWVIDEIRKAVEN